MKRLRAVTEAEVILEFLRNEFHHQDFDRDRALYARLVEDPDVSDERQNALRRALFYRRRGHMLNQLPRDTGWCQVELEDSDLDRLCVLARTHWRKIGGGNCLLRHVVEQIHTRDFHGVRIVGGTAKGGVEISDVGAKVDAIRGFSERMRNREDRSAVLLIGIDDRSPVTILEGNHRLTAALLVSSARLREQFRVYFGASPDMARCCWYGNPTVPNMLRYVANRLRHAGNKEADVARVAAVTESFGGTESAATQPLPPLHAPRNAISDS
ncbi:MAG: hypothetical protein ACXVY9_01450 [Terriglobales bacterium]